MKIKAIISMCVLLTVSLAIQLGWFALVIAPIVLFFVAAAFVPLMALSAEELNQERCRMRNQKMIL